MKRNLASAFLARQHMISQDFEIYYYSDHGLRNVKRHAHDYYEFYFFLEGSVTMHFQDISHVMAAGDMVIIPPGMEHFVRVLETDLPYRRFVFWITDRYLSKLSVHSADFLYLTDLAREKKGFIWHFGEIAFHSIQGKIFQIIEEIYSDRFGRRQKVALGINDLLLSLNRAVYEGLHPECRGSKDERLQSNLVRYIEEHIAENLSLDVLSEKFFVSKYHISHIFTENTGESLHRYVVRKRLTIIKDAIINGEPAAKAAARYGFSDYSVFYRAFVREYGMSPQKYINMLISNLQEDENKISFHKLS